MSLCVCVSECACVRVCDRSQWERDINQVKQMHVKNTETRN